jgi:hypothetical protein
LFRVKHLTVWNPEPWMPWQLFRWNSAPLQQLPGIYEIAVRGWPWIIIHKLQIDHLKLHYLPT